MQKVERSGEPTMEEILASIRQIIAEEPTGVRASPAAAPPTVPPAPQQAGAAQGSGQGGGNAAAQAQPAPQDPRGGRPAAASGGVADPTPLLAQLAQAVPAATGGARSPAPTPAQFGKAVADVTPSPAKVASAGDRAAGDARRPVEAPVPANLPGGPPQHRPASVDGGKAQPLGSQDLGRFIPRKPDTTEAASDAEGDQLPLPAASISRLLGDLGRQKPTAAPVAPAQASAPAAAPPSAIGVAAAAQAPAQSPAKPNGARPGPALAERPAASPAPNGSGTPQPSNRLVTIPATGGFNAGLVNGGHGGASKAVDGVKPPVGPQVVQPSSASSEGAASRMPSANGSAANNSAPLAAGPLVPQQAPAKPAVAVPAPSPAAAEPTVRPDAPKVDRPSTGEMRPVNGAATGAVNGAETAVAAVVSSGMVAALTPSQIVDPRKPVASNAARPMSAASELTQIEGAPIRTLEDTVVELLRPMLRNWLDEHMPRIVEKALRIELADQLKRPVGKSE